ncbi:MAG: phage holin family protein [Patescibacteria group bacterium]
MLKKLIIGIVLNALALYGVIYLVPQIQYTGGITFFAIGGLVMGVLNTIVKPIIKLFTFPLQIITLGLSLILINGLIFWFFEVTIESLAISAVTLVVPAIRHYFLAGFLFGIINWAEHLIVHNK